MGQACAHTALGSRRRPDPHLKHHWAHRICLQWTAAGCMSLRQAKVRWRLAKARGPRGNERTKAYDCEYEKQNRQAGLSQAVAKNDATAPPNLFEPRGANYWGGRDKKYWCNFFSRPDVDRAGQKVGARQTAIGSNGGTVVCWFSKNVLSETVRIACSIVRCVPC